MSAPKRLITGIAALLIIINIGTWGYMLLEGWSFMDALYMTVITITTVGFFEVHALDSAGRIFTMFLIVGGVGGALYTMTGIVEYLLEGRLGSTLWRRKMKNRIVHLKDHFILAGYGRVGQEIARVLATEGADFVVVDKDKDSIAHAEMDGRLCILADAANDEILKEAGIERARGLIVALGNDADSTYIVLSARQLRPDLFIEARISAPEAEAKLKRAGANRIISPYSIGARRMAMLALRPDVADFIDTISYQGQELQMETLTVGNGSPLLGQNIAEARRRSKASVLAITKKHGKLLANPPVEEVIEAGDRLIAIGTREELRAMEGMCESCKPNE